MNKVEFNNIRLVYKGYDISIAQVYKRDELKTSEVAIKDGVWEVVGSFYNITDLQDTLSRVIQIIDEKGRCYNAT